MPSCVSSERNKINTIKSTTRLACLLCVDKADQRLGFPALFGLQWVALVALTIDCWRPEPAGAGTVGFGPIVCGGQSRG